MEENFEMVAKTLFGFEELLENELRQLGAQHIKKGVRNVRFTGDKGFMYKCNMGLRTAIKILKPILQFNVKDENELYKKIKDIAWEKYIDVDATLAVSATLTACEFIYFNYPDLHTPNTLR